MRNAAWLLLALCLVGGCASGRDASGDGASPGGVAVTHSPSAGRVSIPTPTSTVTVGPVSTAWRRSEALRHYRSAMRPVTRGLDALAKMPATASLAQARTALHALATASGDAAGELSKGSWDESSRRHVDTLIAALLDQQTMLNGLADQPDLTAIRAQADKTGQTLVTTRTSAVAVEKDLGIGNGLPGIS